MKIDRPCSKFIYFWKQSGKINMPNYKPSLSMIFQIMARIRFTCAKLREINRPWPKSNHLCMWSRYIRMLHLKQSLPCILEMICGNPKYTVTKLLINWESGQDIPAFQAIRNICSPEICHMDGRTNRKYYAPLFKGGGLNYISRIIFKWM